MVISSTNHLPDALADKSVKEERLEEGRFAKRHLELLEARRTAGY
ncbi:MAG: hypothetical protein ABWK05_08745 [Pyrobaculum sp.]